MASDDVPAKRRGPPTSNFRDAPADDHAGAPAALVKLALATARFVCDGVEAVASIVWVRRHALWLQEPAPVWITVE